MDLKDSDYKYGFSSNLKQEIFEKGLNEEVIKKISGEKQEPDWVLEFRLKAFKYWGKMKEPKWANLDYKPINFEEISYFAKPGKKNKLDSLEEVDPEILAIFKKLGIPLEEQKILSNVAVDAVLDSVSVATTFKKTLSKAGVIFCPISEAFRNHPEIVKKYFGKVVGYKDNFYACLNSAVFSDGTFCYVPKGVKCPMEISTYFRINAEKTGQFERTLLVVEEGGYLSYLEGCTAPERKENQLHAAVVELVAEEKAEIKYSTVQNWYPGDKNGIGGVYNFVTKRGLCKGFKSKISWTQVETGSAVTWKYPSVILQGDESVGEFYSVSLTNNYQQTDTGTKMIHLGKNTKSNIVSKSIASDFSSNTFRSLVKILPSAENSYSHSVCDSLLIGDLAKTFTYPKVVCENQNSLFQQEAKTGEIDQKIKFYLKQRGFSEEKIVSLYINGFTKEIVKKLPLEFGAEANKLLDIKLEGLC